MPQLFDFREQNEQEINYIQTWFIIVNIHKQFT